MEQCKLRVLNNKIDPLLVLISLVYTEKLRVKISSFGCIKRLGKLKTHKMICQDILFKLESFGSFFPKPYSQ